MELFGNARGEFFEFIFVPKSLVYVLLGVVFMTCPHSVLESVEFAEGDSFLDTPNTEHHFDCFYIVGSVVLGVIDLFHIPYQMFYAKIERPSTFRSTGGGIGIGCSFDDFYIFPCGHYRLPIAKPSKMPPVSRMIV